MTKTSRQRSPSLAKKSAQSNPQGNFIILQECKQLCAHIDSEHKLQSYSANTMMQEAEDPSLSTNRRKAKIYSFEPKEILKKAASLTANSSSLEQEKDKQGISNRQKSSARGEKFCRFCLETEETQESGKLICPCRCDGSLKHIHDGCLKKWLVQKDSTVGTIVVGQCEICSSVYHVEGTRCLRFSFSNACDKGLTNLLMAIGMLICLINLGWLVSRYYDSNIENQEPNDGDDVRRDPNQMRYLNQVMLVVFSLLGLVFLLPMLIHIKRAFLVYEIVSLKVYDFDPNYKLDISIEEIGASNPYNTEEYDDVALDVHSEELSRANYLEDDVNANQMQDISRQLTDMRAMQHSNSDPQNLGGDQNTTITDKDQNSHNQSLNLSNVQLLGISNGRE